MRNTGGGVAPMVVPSLGLPISIRIPTSQRPRGLALLHHRCRAGRPAISHLYNIYCRADFRVFECSVRPSHALPEARKLQTHHLTAPQCREQTFANLTTWRRSGWRLRSGRTLPGRARWPLLEMRPAARAFLVGLSTRARPLLGGLVWGTSSSSLGNGALSQIM
jgi:hypothetical protein